MSLLTKLSARSGLLALCNLRTASRFQSTEAAVGAPPKGKPRSSGPLITLGLPVVRTGNDRLQAFHEVLVNKAETVVHQKEAVIYRDKLDEMQFKVGNISLLDPSLGLTEGKFPLSKVRDALEVLTSRIQSLRNGATGPISVPLGLLTPRYAPHLDPGSFDPKRVTAIMLKAKLGPEYALLESIIAVASLDLMSQGVVKPTFFKGRIHSPPPGTPQFALISTNIPNVPLNNLSFDIKWFYEYLYKDQEFREFLVRKDTTSFEELVTDGNFFNGVDVDLGTVEIPGFRIYAGILGEKRQILHEVSF